VGEKKKGEKKANLPAWPMWKRIVLGDRVKFEILAPSLNH